mmetsp:Transcript_56384/g.115345  ORF Transcript_56384/g.115345 Transcript_56384/m.115345 type:complete len:221 (+) Transcript_56384:524-1186(+)
MSSRDMHTMASRPTWFSPALGSPSRRRFTSSSSRFFAAITVFSTSVRRLWAAVCPLSASPSDSRPLVKAESALAGASSSCRACSWKRCSSSCSSVASSSSSTGSGATRITSASPSPGPETRLAAQLSVTGTRPNGRTSTQNTKESERKRSIAPAAPASVSSSASRGRTTSAARRLNVALSAPLSSRFQTSRRGSGMNCSHESLRSASRPAYASHSRMLAR